MLPALLVCLVVGISDGDTLTARCPTGDIAHPYSQLKVRLAEIDAPESGQPYGRRSKEYLSSLCYETEATIRQKATDRYGRTVARVECKGKDANLEMVKAGMAWAYTKYRPTPRFPARSWPRASPASACGPTARRRRRPHRGTSGIRRSH